MLILIIIIIIVVVVAVVVIFILGRLIVRTHIFFLGTSSYCESLYISGDVTGTLFRRT